MSGVCDSCGGFCDFKSEEECARDLEAERARDDDYYGNGQAADPDGPEAIRARYAKQGAHNLAVHERAKRGRPAAGDEPVNVSASLRITKSEDAAIDRITAARKRTGVKWSRSATIRELMLAGLAQLEAP